MKKTFLTPDQLALTEDQLRDLLNERAKIDWAEKLANAQIAYADLVNKRQGAIDLEVKQETKRITEEQGIIWDEKIEDALEAVATVKKDALDKKVILDLKKEKGKEGGSVNPLHHLSWTGPQFGIWLLKYRADHPEYEVDTMIGEYNEFRSGGNLKGTHLLNCLKVEGWTTEEIQIQLDLTYDCKCCADSGIGWTRPVRK